MVSHDVRRYIRHPSDIPIEVTPQEGAVDLSQLKDVSEGGLSFQSQQPLRTGELITIHIPFVEPEFFTEGLVVWCEKHISDGYDIGISFFHTEDVFKARMVEQICHIEQYRQKMANQGRELTGAEAAMEWIDKYAAYFVQPEDMIQYH